MSRKHGKSKSKAEFVRKVYPCPLCGRRYPTPKLANHCVNPACVAANRASLAVGAEWRIRALTATLVMVAAETYERDAATSPAARDMADRLHEALAEIYARLRRDWPVTSSYSYQHKDLLQHAVGSVWGWQSHQPAAHVLETMLCCVEDVREHVSAAELGMWSRLYAVLDDALAASDPEDERPGHERTDAAYLALRRVIWPYGEGREPQLRPWLACDAQGPRLYVAAYSRQEARRIVARETGLVSLRIRGVDPSTHVRMADWSGAIADLLPGKPGIMERAA